MNSNNNGQNGIQPMKKEWFKKNKITIYLGIVIIVSLICLWILGRLPSSSFFLNQLVSAILIACIASLIVRLINYGEKSDLDKRKEDIIEGENTLKEMQQEIRNTLNSVEGRKCTFCENSIVSVRRNRNECKLEDFFDNARKEICILATHLESFAKYADQLCSLSCNNNISIKIATLDPDSSSIFNSSRDNDPNANDNEKKAKMNVSINIFLDYMRINKNHNMELKKYSEITTSLVLIFRDNEFCYVANLIHGKKTRDTMHLLIKNDSKGDSPYAMFKSHFDAIYNNKEKCEKITP